MPEQAEVLGLLALMLHCEARRAARRTAQGEYVPLSEQDVGLWSTSLLDEAEACLARAAQAGSLGRFQLEAAIQSAHAQRARTSTTDWQAIALLYEGLVRLAPSIGALVGRAAAVAEARGAAAGWALLQEHAWRSRQQLSTVLGAQRAFACAHGPPRRRRAARMQRAIGLCQEPCRARVPGRAGAARLEPGFEPP